MPKGKESEKRKKLASFVRKMQTGSKKNISSNVYLGSDIPDEQIISTGFPFLDWFLGGGWRRGRHHLIYGPSSVGKTTLMIQSAKRMIDNDLIVQYNDVEDFLEQSYLKMRGVDPEAFVWSPEKDGMKILNTAIEFAKEDITDVMIVDTLAAMQTAADVRTEKRYKNVGEQDVAQLAMMLTDYFKKISATMRDSKLAAIYLNQIRSRGVGGGEDYDPMFFRDGVSINGGKALMHYCALSAFMKRAAKSKLRASGKYFEFKDESSKDQRTFGFAVEFAVRKSKLMSIREFTSINLEYNYEDGFNDRLSLAEYMYKVNAYEGTTWIQFDYQGYTAKEQGMENMRQRIMEDDELYQKSIDFLWDNRNDILNMSIMDPNEKDKMIKASGVKEGEADELAEPESDKS